MNSRQLQYVVTLAEEKNFTKAAKRLIIAQPSLSQYINKLEKELGHTLFDRTSTPLRLTAAGELYVEMARRILDMEAQTEKCLSDMQNSQYGRLVIGCAPHRERCIVSPKLPRFMEKYPNYSIVLYDYPYYQMMKSLDNGEMDLCIVTTPFNDAKYVIEEICSEEILLAVPERHPINDRLTILSGTENDPYPLVDISEFRDMLFLTVNEENGMYDQTFELCREAGFRPQKTIECGNFDVCRDLVAEGLGATLLLSSIVEYGKNQEDIRCYRLVQAPPPRKVAAIYRKKHYISNAAQDFIEILKS